MKPVTSVSRRSCLALGAACGAALISGKAWASTPLSAVVELFTSQGCSSCPKADAFMADLRARPGVAVLTYHVDYWDYLGWKDTLADPEFSQRQYDYAKARGDMDVYTPQLIVNGRKHFVGSNRDEIVAALDAAASAPWAASIALSESGSEIVVEVGAGAVEGDATVWLMPIQPSATVTIERGENAGNEIQYHNVVRHVVPAGMWNGSATRLSLSKAAVLTPDCEGCVALLQHGKAGTILGAARWGVTGA